MDRRAFLIALFAVCGCGPNDAPKAGASDITPTAAAPSGDKQRSGVLESKTKVPRVAMLVFGTPSDSSAATGTTSVTKLLRDRLTELGYVDGKTILFEESYADGDPQRLTQLAHQIVERKPDVIVTIAASATAAVRQATSTIPIVMAHAGSPVESGLVASLAHPGPARNQTSRHVPSTWRTLARPDVAG